MRGKRFIWFALLALAISIPAASIASALAHPPLGPWAFHSDMNRPRPNSPIAITDEYIYVSGGGVLSQGLPHQDTVDRARLLPNGELGPWELTSTMTTRRSAHAGASWNNVIYFGGGSVGNFDRLSSVEMATEVSGVLSAFTPTASLNAARVALAFVRHENCLFAMGGAGSSGAELRVEVTGIDPVDGDLLGWSFLPPANDLPRPVFDVQAARTETHIYLGQNAGTLPMLRAEILGSCTLGPWQETGDPLPARFDAAAIAGDRLYLTGGAPLAPSTPQERGRRVISAAILSNGDLGPWDEEPDMTEERESTIITPLGPFLYAIGGQVPFGHRTSVERALLPSPPPPTGDDDDEDDDEDEDEDDDDDEEEDGEDDEDDDDEDDDD